MTIRKILSNLDLIIVIPHELAHIAAGCLIGVRVVFHDARHVAVPIDIPIWKHLLITIAPTVLGIAIFAGFISIPFIHDQLPRLRYGEQPMG